MKVIKEVIIEKNIQDVWEVMGNQFGQVHLWSSNFLESKPEGESKFEGLAYSSRKTLTERGETIQELDVFDANKYSLSYYITKGAPEFAEQTGAVWSLSSEGLNTTKATFEFSMVAKAMVNEEMASKIEMGLTRSASEMAEELKYYLENGQPHSRKLNQ
jgi:Asp-tRNA(Asn)/Glu-tRNA(Gln) amidotransferase A subunit family amidase